MGERKTIFLIDNSSIQYGEDRLKKNITATLYDAVKDPELIDKAQIKKYIRHTEGLEAFSRRAALTTIDEVLVEHAEYLRILREQYDLIRKAIAKSSLPREKAEELQERVGLVRVCADNAADFMSSFENRRIYPEELNGSESKLHNWGYERAMARYRKFNQDAPTQTETTRPKLGSLLETDLKLVAMAMALSLSGPVTLISRDYNMKKTLRWVDERAGPNWQGRTRYKIDAVRDHYDVSDQTLKPMIVRLTQDTPTPAPETVPESTSEQTQELLSTE